MTNGEAIDILNGLIHPRVPKSAITARKENEAYRMAIEALEKQIPKKPVWKLDSYYHRMGKGKKAPCCQICFEDLLDEKNDCFKFCPECGQAVDWSD